MCHQVHLIQCDFKSERSSMLCSDSDTNCSVFVTWFVLFSAGTMLMLHATLLRVCSCRTAKMAATCCVQAHRVLATLLSRSGMSIGLITYHIHCLCAMLVIVSISYNLTLLSFIFMFLLPLFSLLFSTIYLLFISIVAK